jgi:hypothetical protein
MLRLNLQSLYQNLGNGLGVGRGRGVGDIASIVPEHLGSKRTSAKVGPFEVECRQLPKYDTSRFVETLSTQRRRSA